MAGWGGGGVTQREWYSHKPTFIFLQSMESNLKMVSEHDDTQLFKNKHGIQTPRIILLTTANNTVLGKYAFSPKLA